jgi:hypothetical protein
MPLAMKMKFSSLLAAGILALGMARPAGAQTPAAPGPGHFQARYFGRFSELPVGAVQPRGWLQQWLERQAQGLTGHPENMSYPYDTCMYAGTIPPPQTRDKWWKEWWPYEQSAYFVDATTRLSWLINNPSINRRRDDNLDYILAHSSGTNLGSSHECWPNAVVGRALLAQFSATGDPRVAATLQNWLLTSAGEIEKGGRSGANFEEAFFLYGLTGDRRLLEIGQRVYAGYLKDAGSFCSAEKIEGEAPFHEHGVTAAEELKCLPMMYLYTGDETALRLANRAYNKVLDNSLMADGGIVSSEHLERAAFYSVHESCDITDWSWSLGYLFMATGETHFADLIERATFNALPGAVTKDFKQLQYFSAVNQTVIAATNSHTPRWPTRMTYRAAHDTACCAGNINRAMPDYVIRMWMRSQDDGLAAVYYGPSEVTTTVGGQKISIAEETEYPFRDTISFRVRTSGPVAFDFQCRIPGWCTNATITVNGQIHGATPEAGTFAGVQREFHDGDTVVLKLPMPVRVENWFHDQSVCVTRGPLVYALKIAGRRVEHTNDPPEMAPFLLGHAIAGFPEVEFYPESDWRYGFSARLKNDLSQIKTVESVVTDNPFIEDQTPVHLELPLCHLPGWASDAAAEPAGLPNDTRPPAEDSSVVMTLVPYGATHLRLTTLPLIPDGKKSGALEAGRTAMPPGTTP